MSRWGLVTWHGSQAQDSSDLGGGRGCPAGSPGTQVGPAAGQRWQVSVCLTCSSRSHRSVAVEAAPSAAKTTVAHEASAAGPSRGQGAQRRPEERASCRECPEAP